MEQTTPAAAPAARALKPGMDFGEALKALHAGNTIARHSWVTKAGHIKGLHHDPDHKFLGEEKPTTGSIQCRQMINGESYQSHFSLHERDILADDWVIIPPMPEPHADANA